MALTQLEMVLRSEPNLRIEFHKVASVESKLVDPRPGGRNQDGRGMTKSDDFFFFRLRISLPRSGNHGVCDGESTHTPCRTHIIFALFPCVTYRHEHAWLKVFAVCVCVISLHLALSILMFHPPSLLFPHCQFDTTFSSAPSSSSFTRPISAGQAHLRTCAGEFGFLADPTHLQVMSPKSSTRPLL